ncbi:hypothetical protein OHA25_47750 [Nonomuraea sp. NBC_00507]|uniref:hypothetical protein n=1 Tax=Nonomuraea sp. NBC_00507 TaxID=2976002 RepID=UPI002E18581E
MIDTLECRSIADVVFMSLPAARDSVAAPWRSCSRIGGRPAANANRSKCSLTQSGVNSLPSSRVKIRPVSVHADPHASRSSSCRALCARRTATVTLSSATTASDDSVFGDPSFTSRPTLVSCVAVASRPRPDHWWCLMQARSVWARVGYWLPLGGGHRALGDARDAHELARDRRPARTLTTGRHA